MTNKDNDNEFIQKVIKYYKSGKTIREVAKLCDCSTGKAYKIIRGAGQIRDASEAQQLTYKKGRVSPTKGRERTPEEKLRISEGLSETYNGWTEEQKRELSQKRSANMKKMSKAEREYMRERANHVISKTKTEGSKLERHLHSELLNRGYKVEFHREQLVQAERLQMDLFLPVEGIVVEVDGFWHYENRVGDERYQKAVEQDKKKNDLLLSSGFSVIRLRTTPKSISDKYKRDLVEITILCLEKLKNKAPQIMIVDATNHVLTEMLASMKQEQKP